MTIQSLLLDDLKWRDMVLAIRGRIAAVSNEEWTLHAPVDPGVTLLELFAYLLEQRVFWLDQVPDALINALVALLGAEPHPAVAARTVLELTEAAAGLVPAGAVFEPRDHDSPVRLATDDEAALLSIERLEIASGFGATKSAFDSTPRWAMQPLTVLPADSSAAEVVVTLWLRQPPTGAQRGRALTLLLDLDTSMRIASSWSVDAVTPVTVPAEVTWRYSTVGGAVPFAADALVDGTQGLRRSGLVRFQIPADWAPVGPAAAGLTPYCLWFATDRSGFSAPPRLHRLVPNVVAARHAVAVTVPVAELEAQVAQWLPLPGLALQLSDLPPLEDSVALRLKSRDGAWRDWKPCRDFARFGPEDAVFKPCRTFNRLDFGDGLTGRLPVLAAPGPARIGLSYLAGGGVIGNVGANLPWISDAPVAASAVNPVPARGGAESETSAEARDRVSASLEVPTRAVTASDYETLAVGTPGVAVARARALPGHHPEFPCLMVPGAVSVFIVPEVPREDGWLHSDRAVSAPLPDPGMLAEVRARLDARRLLTAEVFVLAPVYRPVEVSVTLAGAPLDKAAVGDRLRDGLALYLDALSGGPDGTGWPFGDALRPSEFAHVLEGLAGEDAVVERVALRLADSTDQLDDCNDLDLAAFELPVLQSLVPQWHPRTDRAGGLR